MAKETTKKPSLKKGTSHKSTSSHSTTSTKKKSSSGSSAKARKKRKSAKKKRMWIFGIEIFMLALLLVGFYVVRQLDKIQKPEMPDKAEIEPNEKVNDEPETMLTGYTNIALFGLDTRTAGQLGKGNRSDTMIIASINNDTKEVKLVSVYRDSYLDLTNGRFDKCNGAYSAGGPGQAIMMLNTNLDLDIENYVSVDFAALTETVDILGGVSIDVDDTEIGHLNNYIKETSEVTGVKTKKLTETGLQLLDGVQATSYCRIRYTAGDDFKRTERQREVLMEIVNKMKKADISKINDIIDAVFPMVATSYEHDELIALAPQMLGYEIVDTIGFPFDKANGKIQGKGECVIPVNLAENVRQLHEYLFDDYDYEPSDTIVKIGNQITQETGY